MVRTFPGDYVSLKTFQTHSLSYSVARFSCSARNLGEPVFSSLNKHLLSTVRQGTSTRRRKGKIPALVGLRH